AIVISSWFRPIGLTFAPLISFWFRPIGLTFAPLISSWFRPIGLTFAPLISSWFRPIGLTFAPLITIVQWLIVALGAPLLVGVIRKTKARLQGRRGAGVWQPYWNLRKLLIKEVVVSENTSWIFRLTPYVAIGTMLLSAFIVPVLTTAGPLQFLGNIILLMYVSLLNAFFLALAGLDAGSSFGGMGASRVMAIAALAEPPVMVGSF